MKTITSSTIKTVVILLILPFCHQPTPPIRSNVMTEADQKQLTPELVIEQLKEGNQNYQQNHLTLKDDTAMIHKTARGQYPEAFVLACMDSRVPVEEIFDRGIGDLFVGRVAGNIIDDDVLGSIEYGCKIAGARLIVVLGHESCGAVKAAIEKEELGNITTLLAKIKPAIEASQHVAGEHSAGNPDFVAAVVQNNIRNSIKDIRSKSAVLKEMEDKGEVKIVGAYYSLHTGEVTFYP
jgi:carbonic anhydrase